MKKKPTVTIGIPAYNEEANIGYLLKDLLAQKGKGFAIEQIIVASDGSTDSTIMEVKNIKSKKIKLIDNKVRKGTAMRQNQILNMIKSDVLVLLDADISLKNPYFIKKLVMPIVKDKNDLVSCILDVVEPATFFEKVLRTSFSFKNRIYEQHRQGINVYTCHGAARAISKKLYKQLRFPESIGEDAYSYFYCITEGFKYTYATKTEVLIESPDNLVDHQRQSIRFFQSKRIMANIFGEKLIQDEYYIPFNLLIREVILNFLRHPFYFGLYLSVLIYMRIKSIFAKEISNKWKISLSSKKLI